jgi:hypothetical protein
VRISSSNNLPEIVGETNILDLAISIADGCSTAVQCAILVEPAGVRVCANALLTN